MGDRFKSVIVENKQFVKALKHLNLWEIKRKRPPRANAPPTEATIIYDESSSPGADDPASPLKLRRIGYIIDANYPMDLSRRSFSEDGPVTA